MPFVKGSTICDEKRFKPGQLGNPQAPYERQNWQLSQTEAIQPIRMTLR